MRLSFTLTNENITVFYEGKIFNIPSTSTRFNELKDHLRLPTHDPDYVESILNIKTAIERFSQGHVKIYGNDVYYKDIKVRTRIGQRLVELYDDGFEITPWINFMEKVMQNPSEDSRERLFTFLEKNESPLTEDGDFIGFKRVKDNFKDIYTGTMDNSPGSIVEVDREDVDDNNNQTCSYGLHIAASIYLDKGPTVFATVEGNKTIVCKVNPKDVVAVPSDYNETKMRVCRYEVLSEVSVGRMKDIETKNTYGEISKINDSYKNEISHDTTNEHYNVEKSDIDHAFDFLRRKLGNLDLKIELGGYNFYAIYFNSAEQFKKYGLKFIEYVNNILEDLDIKVDPVLAPLENLEILFAFPDGNGKYIFFDFDAGEFYSDIDAVYPDYYIDNLYFDQYDIDVVMEEMIEDGFVVLNNNINEPSLAETTEEEKTDLTFVRNGVTYTESEILNGIQEHGSIAKWARVVGVPRSTAQDWVKKIIKK